MKNMKTLHFNISIRLNESDYTWHDPDAREDILFSIPASMFSSKNFQTLLDQTIEDLIDKFETIKEEYQKEQAEKAKAEAENLVLEPADK